MTYVTFPNLSISLSLQRKMVSLPFLGGGIYYYAIIICMGFILAWLYVSHLERKRFGHSENVLDILLWAVPVSIISARIYYVAFSFTHYKDNLLDVFKIWEGGIAIYGAVIGAFLVVYIYTKLKKLPTLHYFDLAAVGILIGQIVGRWGNFVNGEAHGGICANDFLLAMTVNGEGPFHPTFFYESSLNLIGFLLIHFLSKKFTFDGFKFYFYLAYYGLVRFFVEDLRTDSLYIFGIIRVSQALSLVLFIAGTILLVKSIRQNMPKIQ